MTLYIGVFKPEITLRILDIFLCEGPKIIFRVYLDAFKKTKEELLTLSCDQILYKIKELNQDYSADEVIKSTFKISLSRKRLKEIEKEYESNPNLEFKNW